VLLRSLFGSDCFSSPPRGSNITSDTSFHQVNNLIASRHVLLSVYIARGSQTRHMVIRFIFSYTDLQVCLADNSYSAREPKISYVFRVIEQFGKAFAQIH